jgi:predicted dehydrogenase
MKPKPLKTVLVGFGKVGALYADDPVMAKEFPYATHAQVLDKHPAFSWEGVIDISTEACELAKSQWKVDQAVSKASLLRERENIEVAVIATPPNLRLEVLKELPALRAVLFEKPLATSAEESKVLLDYCNKRNILVQVNFWRRADQKMIALASNELFDFIGDPQVIFGLYGNGVANNGIHLIDLIRMLFGEIREAQSHCRYAAFKEGPLRNDTNLPFSLLLEMGIMAMVQPLRYSQYRELGLDVWGNLGRLSILQEGGKVIFYPIGPCRTRQGEREVVSEKVCSQKTDRGHALWDM